MDLRKLLMMLLVAVLPLGFIACDDDDDDQEEITLKEQVVGKWEISKIAGIETSSIKGLLAMSGIDVDLSIELKSGGTLVVSDLEDTGTYTVSEEKATITCVFRGQTIEVEDVAVNNKTLEATLPADKLDLSGIMELIPESLLQMIGSMLNGPVSIICEKA